MSTRDPAATETFMNFLMPGESHHGQLPALTPQERDLAARLRSHVETIATTIGPRNILAHPQALHRTADWIESTFRELGYEPNRQDFTADGENVYNIDIELPGASKADEILVIGA